MLGFKKPLLGFGKPNSMLLSSHLLVEWGLPVPEVEVLWQGLPMPVVRIAHLPFWSLRCVQRIYWNTFLKKEKLKARCCLLCHTWCFSLHSLHEQIVYAERPLTDNNRSLASYGLKDGDVVILRQKETVEPRPSIRFPGEEGFVLNFCSERAKISIFIKHRLHLLSVFFSTLLGKILRKGGQLGMRRGAFKIG